MNNPYAVAAAANIGGKIAVKTGDFVSNNAKTILVVILSIFAITFGPKYYKEYVAKKFIRDNPANIYVRASFIIANSVKTFAIPTFFGNLFSFNYNVNESSINNALASVGANNFAELARVYYKLFSRNLDSDLQSALDEEELQSAYDVIDDVQSSTSFAIGTLLKVKAGADITVNQAIYEAGMWAGTDKLMDTSKNVHKAGEEIGIVHFKGIVSETDLQHAGKTYYIVENCNWFGFDCDYGVVLNSQVTNK
jgi:hypothetical protein